MRCWSLGFRARKSSQVISSTFFVFDSAPAGAAIVALAATTASPVTPTIHPLISLISPSYPIGVSVLLQCSPIGVCVEAKSVPWTEDQAPSKCLGFASRHRDHLKSPGALSTLMETVVRPFWLGSRRGYERAGIIGGAARGSRGRNVHPR